MTFKNAFKKHADMFQLPAGTQRRKRLRAGYESIDNDPVKIVYPVVPEVNFDLPAWQRKGKSDRLARELFEFQTGRAFPAFLRRQAQ